MFLAKRAVLFFCLLGMIAPISFSQTFKVAVSAEKRDAYLEFRRNNGNDGVKLLTNYNDPALKDRELLDILIIEQAFFRAGVEDAKLELVPYDAIEFTLSDLREADSESDIVATSFSYERKKLNKIKEEVYITTAVIESKDTHYGFFVDKQNSDILEVSSQEDLQDYTTMSSSLWSADWEAVTGIGLGRVLDGSWGEQQDALIDGDTDFIIRPFSRMSLTITHSDGTQMDLIPIPNLKMALPSTRHYPIAKRHPQGRFFNAALNLGLIKMKKDGTILRALKQTNYINDDVKDWTTIEPVTQSVLGIMSF
ncbi:hypothetical protein [Marinicellulosiphila megalodicopiae]|uniref:hypothetical protein n=1 Tax=Marinicellulosiphila megalodicopiae TaxID=2724896 RepID=UPI003BAFE84A